MRNKDIIKMLKREANNLPTEFYVAHHKAFIYPDKDEAKLTTPMIVQVPEEHIVNHGRRLKRLWKKHKSIFEIALYFRQRGFELRWR